MLLSYSSNSQSLLRLPGSETQDSYLYTFSNPYLNYQIDTSVCFSIPYGKNLLFWAKRGVYSEDVIKTMAGMNTNLNNQLVIIDKMNYLLINQVNDQAEQLMEYKSEKNRLNTELGSQSIKLNEERALNADLKNRNRKITIWAFTATALAVTFGYLALKP